MTVLKEGFIGVYNRESHKTYGKSILDINKHERDSLTKDSPYEIILNIGHLDMVPPSLPKGYIPIISSN